MLTAEQILAFQQAIWPDVYIYDKQREILVSSLLDGETDVPAANMMGKDFIAGLSAIIAFLLNPVARVVTTSVDQEQLEKVLWGEIHRFVQTAVCDLSLVVKHCDIRKIVDGQVCPTSYLTGRVASRENEGAGLLGHHAPYTLGIIDEASAFAHSFKAKIDTWAKHRLIIGNTYECQNFFRYAIKGGDPENQNDRGGDIPRLRGKGYVRRIIRIKAEDSPNVRYALSQKKQGIEPDNRAVIPGVLSWDEYQERRKHWSPRKQCISLDAEFYEGAEEKLYPPEWLNRAGTIADSLEGKSRHVETIGCDPAEGGDDTVWTMADRYGIIQQISKKTPNTAAISNETIALIKQYHVDPKNVYFDRGGGGKQHADQLRERGYDVQTVAFGEAVQLELNRGVVPFKDRKEFQEHHYEYKNRRAEMYGMLRNLLDPGINPKGFGIAHKETELRRQMTPIPLSWDTEGRMYVLSKQRKDRNSREVTLTELIGNSPDELDSAVLAVYGMMRHKIRPKAGAV